MKSIHRTEIGLGLRALMLLAIVVCGCSDKGTGPGELVSVKMLIGLSASEYAQVDIRIGRVSDPETLNPVKTLQVRTDGQVEEHTLTMAESVADDPFRMEFPEGVSLPTGYEGPFSYTVIANVKFGNSLTFSIVPETPETFVLLGTKNRRENWILSTALKLTGVPEDGESSSVFLLDAAQHFEEDRSYVTAIQIYEILVSKYLTTEQGATARKRIPEVLYLMAEEHWVKAEYSQAIAFYDRIIEEYPTSDPRASAEARAAEHLYQIGEEHQERGEYQDAIHYYDRVITGYPESSYRDDAEKRIPEILYRTGEEHRERGEYQDAIHYYERVIAEYPESLYRDDAEKRMPETLYRTGEQSREKEDYRTAIRYYERVIAEYPESSYRDDAERRMPETLYQIGEVHQADMQHFLSLGDKANSYYQGAIEYYQRVIDEYPFSLFADLARERIVECNAAIGSTTIPMPAIEEFHIPGLGTPIYYIENRTEYVLTVRLSPEGGSARISTKIQPGKNKELEVPAGVYEVVVSVSKTHVNPIVGEQVFKQDHSYASIFYVLRYPRVIGKLISTEIALEAESE